MAREEAAKGNHGLGLMRFFKKKDADATLAEPRVVGDTVYDEHGEVLYSPEPVAETPPVEAETFALPEAHDLEIDNDPFVEPEDETAFATAELTDTGTFTDIPSSDIGERLSVDIPDELPTIDVTQPDSTPGTRTPELLHKRVNLSEVRMDVARITSDIQSGERLYQRAQQRVESLMGFVERAEVDFSLLNRLEPENKRLKARNRVLETENDAAAHEQRRLRNELDEAKAYLEETQRRLDANEAKLGAVTTQAEERARELRRLTEELSQSGMKLERTQTSVEVESRENVVLRDQITSLSTRIDDLTSERMELAKIVESLKIDCDDFRAQRDTAQSEVSDLRVSLSTAQKVNGEMKTQMMTLHEEIKGFKTQYEFNVISREDRITNLEARLADMAKQVRIKDDVARSAMEDVAQLRKARTAQDVERERLERIIEAQQRQIDDANAQVQRSQASMSELDQRYNDVAAALSMHQKRLTPAGDAAPLSPPPPFAEDIQDAGPDDLTPENVEDLITDYKLGLRSGLG